MNTNTPAVPVTLVPHGEHGEEFHDQAHTFDLTPWLSFILEQFPEELGLWVEEGAPTNDEFTDDILDALIDGPEGKAAEEFAAALATLDLSYLIRFDEADIERWMARHWWPNVTVIFDAPPVWLCTDRFLLIRSMEEFDEDDGDGTVAQPLFWSNNDGWTTYPLADRFLPEERDTLRLPDGGEWVAATPDALLSPHNPHMKAPAYICPDTERHKNDIVGCGAVVVAEPDFEGLVDCTSCGMWFRATGATNIERAQAVAVIATSGAERVAAPQLLDITAAVHSDDPDVAVAVDDLRKTGRTTNGMGVLTALNREWVDQFRGEVMMMGLDAHIVLYAANVPERVPSLSGKARAAAVESVRRLAGVSKPVACTVVDEGRTDLLPEAHRETVSAIVHECQTGVASIRTVAALLTAAGADDANAEDGAMSFGWGSERFATDTFSRLSKVTGQQVTVDTGVPESGMGNPWYVARKLLQAAKQLT